MPSTLSQGQKQAPKHQKLSKQEKVFLVTCFAVYETPSQAAKAFEAHFGRPISRAHAAIYDAGNPEMLHRLGADLKDLYKRVNERFRNQTENIPIANKSWRLKRLSELVTAEMERDKPNKVIVLQALEQAAKEKGGAYEGKVVMSGPNGGPVAVQHTHIPADIPDAVLEQWERLLINGGASESG